MLEKINSLKGVIEALNGKVKFLRFSTISVMFQTNRRKKSAKN